MSLRIALEQIQLKAWLPPKETYQEKTQSERIAMAQQKRHDTLEAIRSAGKRVDCAWIVGYTGYSIQSIRYQTDKLVLSGQIKRIETTDGHVFWEAV